MTRSVANYGSGDLISVIMPVHNTPEDWLDAAVASVRRQRGRFRVELLICDDGSDEATAKYLARLESGAAGDPDGLKISVVRNDLRSGPSAARNRAAEAASGRYLVWLDSDDELPAGAVRALLRRARKTGAWMVLSRCEVRDGNRREVRDSRLYLDLARQLHGTSQDPLAQVVFSVQAQLVDAVAFKQIGGFNQDYAWAEVTEFFLRFVRCHGIARVAQLNSVAYRYYRREGSLSSRRDAHEQFRREALRSYYDECVAGPALEDVSYHGRAGLTGAQHFRLSTAGLALGPEYEKAFMHPGPAGRIGYYLTTHPWPARLLATGLAALVPWAQTSLSLPLLMMVLALPCAVVSGLPRGWLAPFFARPLAKRMLEHRTLVGTAGVTLLVVPVARSLRTGSPAFGAQLFAVTVAAVMIGYLSVAPRPGLRARLDRTWLLSRAGAIGAMIGCGYALLMTPLSPVAHDLAHHPWFSVMALSCATTASAAWRFVARHDDRHLILALAGWSAAVGAFTAGTVSTLVPAVRNWPEQITPALPAQGWQLNRPLAVAVVLAAAAGAAVGSRRRAGRSPAEGLPVAQSA